MFLSILGLTTYACVAIHCGGVLEVCLRVAFSKTLEEGHFHQVGIFKKSPACLCVRQNSLLGKIIIFFLLSH